MGLAIKPPPGTPGKAWPAIVVGFFVAFGGVLFGYEYENLRSQALNVPS